MKGFVVTSLTIIMLATEHLGLNDSVSGSYSEGSRFESLPSYLLISFRFSLAFPSSSKQMK